jgi:cytochrome c-type biogenesis protein CcmE
MKPRTKRGLAIAGGLASLGIATYLVLQTFQSNLVFFFSPSQVVANEAPKNKPFRIGGLVKDPGGLKVSFIVTDTAHDVRVQYEGLLPDLFKEGKGVVAQGQLGSNGLFEAKQVLAKHDENYMPPEAAEALEKAKAKQPQTAPTLQEPQGAKK